MALSNLLGVVLAFVTVLLLLSLVVMGLVQFSQALLRLRSRNLLVGVSWLLDSPAVQSALAPNQASQSAQTPTSGARSLLRRDEKLRKSARLLAQATDVHRRLVPGRDPNATINVIRGPKVAWVEPRDVAQAVAEEHGRGNDAVAVTSVAEQFNKLEPALRDRFATNMQQWTAVWAVVVAIVFQVSAPTLLHSLSVSDARREAIIAMVPDVIRQSEGVIPASMADDFVDRALARLAQDYPERSDLFAEVSGSIDSREEMLNELRAVLARVPERDAIVARYSVIIDAMTVRDVNAAVGAAGSAIDSLDVAGIGFWKDGTAFYIFGGSVNVQNVVGVLTTALLLSFGAPFWFEQVKNVASLRSALARQESR